MRHLGRVCRIERWEWLSLERKTKQNWKMIVQLQVYAPDSEYHKDDIWTELV